MHFFIEGLFIGLAYLAPIGMQNLYVINTAMHHNRSRSLAAALIVIFFDITLSISCFFGIGSIIDYFQAVKLFLLALGSILLMFIGLNLIRHPDTACDNKFTNDSLPQTIYKSCIVTWCNPQAIIDGTIMLGAFHAIFNNDEAVFFLTGIVTASFIWFIGLSFFVSSFNNKINKNIFAKINLVCGAIIIGYGLKLFYELSSSLI
ncbi:LysE/ArgO family amino acid transporter [Pectinatus sottacetonis]|uniref:LysE/ArgO family amino acid transporter n=1 Tax=Pectinatus sottacetonis TaxID=1002795 RepID=UPI0018C4F809|nr:LysE family transporter [Pectinatus sottacetonis]